MADNKKYYYLKLKENFFDSDSMILLENMKDGYLYGNILLKLYLKSLKDGGRLMLNGRIPYNSQMIASVTRHQVGTVEKALKIFEELGLIELLDSGAIYMLDIQNLIGESSTEADRKREYRARIEMEKASGQMTDKCPDKYPPEIEKEIDIKKEIDICTEPDKPSSVPASEQPVISLILNDKTSYPIYQKDVDSWKELYPAVDITQELRKMKGWCNANPGRRKTARGIKRFINNWLSKEQDQSRIVEVKENKGNLEGWVNE